MKTGGRVRSSPVVVDGVVYAGSWDRQLYALDAKTGQELWKMKTGKPIQSFPAVMNSVVYVVGRRPMDKELS